MITTLLLILTNTGVAFIASDEDERNANTMVIFVLSWFACVTFWIAYLAFQPAPTG